MKPGTRRLFGIVTGLVLGGVVVGWSASRDLHRPGPMNTGHADLACTDCHRAAPGSVRQQLQNAVRDVFGTTNAPVDVGFAAVDNNRCVACHERPDDRHPVFRFLEPRFADARAAIHPERCMSCHREHSGKRVTATETTFCRHCHADTALEKDPLDVSHRALVANKQWSTCLGCHDYHGNHVFKAPHRIDQAFDPRTIRQYFDGGFSPYSAPIVRASKRKATSP